MGVLDKIFTVFLMVFLSSLIYLLYDLIHPNSIPFDDLANHIESIECENNTCEINFTSPVQKYEPVDATGSMIPVIGGGDYYICLNTTPKIGDMVVTPKYIHFLYGTDGQWGITRGLNNQNNDPYMTPLEDMCVVGAIMR